MRAACCIAVCLGSLAAVVSPAVAQLLIGERVRSVPGASVEFSLVFQAERQAVSGLQFEIPFSEVHSVAADERDQPACRVNPDIDKPASVFAFVPPDCNPRVSGQCRAVRALVFALGEPEPIADGVRVATCTLLVRPFAPLGRVPIEITELAASSPRGELLRGARAVAGELEIVTDLPPTSTPTPTPSFSPTPTPTPTSVAACVGDCDGDGAVSIDELLLMVLDSLAGEAWRCPRGDPNGDGTVTIEEIIAAVAIALTACPGSGHDASGRSSWTVDGGRMLSGPTA